MTVEKKLYTIEPILEERIWGGQELIKMFNLNLLCKYLQIVVLYLQEE